MGSVVPVLLLTGTVGSGKTTLAYEIADVLTERRVPHAAIDLDGLTVQWPPSSRWNADLMFQNLASLWPNFRASGATHLVVAHVLEDETDKARYREAVPGADLTVVRVTAPEDLRLRRLRQRMLPGSALDWHLTRTVQLEAILRAAAHEDFTIDNGDRPVRTAALEVLRRAAWI